MRFSFTTFKDLVRFAVTRATEERITQVASSLTFTTTLSIVPLVAVGLAILTAFPVFGQLQTGLHALIGQNLLPGTVSDTIFRYIDQFSSKARGLTFIGLFFLSITAVSTMLTVDRALNRIWHVRRPRPLSRRLLVYWAVLTIGPLLLSVSLTLTSYLAGASAGFIIGPSMTVRVLIDLVPILVLGMAYAALYVLVPNRKVRWRDAWTGGLCAAFAFEVAKRVFAAYISRFPTYATIYGAVAALPIFLVWVYLSWLITLAGATLAASLPLLYERAWRRGNVAGQEYSDALRLLRILYLARYQQTPGLSTLELEDRAQLGWDDAQPILECLEENGMVIRTRPVAPVGATKINTDELWIFTADPEQIRLARLFELFAYDGRAIGRIGFDRDDPLVDIVSKVPSEDDGMTLENAFGGATPREPQLKT